MTGMLWSRMIRSGFSRGGDGQAFLAVGRLAPFAGERAKQAGQDQPDRLAVVDAEDGGGHWARVTTLDFEGQPMAIAEQVGPPVVYAGLGFRPAKRRCGKPTGVPRVQGYPSGSQLGGDAPGHHVGEFPGGILLHRVACLRRRRGRSGV